MRIIIVGCGLGGLSCAISCRKEGLEVVVLERTAKLLPVGAGIQISPNATKVMRHFGMEDKLKNHGAIEIKERVLRRYEDGRILCVRPGGEQMVNEFGASYYVIHRADYQQVLYDEAVRLGVQIRLEAEVRNVSSENGQASATLIDGNEINGDVIVVADGLWSSLRGYINSEAHPEETGDLAYRGTFSRRQLEKLNDPRVHELLEDQKNQLWMGPGKHCSFYPLKNNTEFNLVLIRPDNLPIGTRTARGDISEMVDTFKDWDPVLQTMISCLDNVLKWKLLHMTELETWTKGPIALLGDSCHPSLPYQAQGAAMAVEDGAVLGLLLGRLYAAGFQDYQKTVPSILKLYEGLRKSRTTVNVQGSIRNRDMFHLKDGPDQVGRDEALAKVNWIEGCEWQWGDIEYMRQLWGFDAVADARVAMEKWLAENGPQV